jgi:hypothetical protein
MPDLNLRTGTPPDGTQWALSNPLIQTILQIPYVVTCLLILCLNLQPLLLPLALLGLELDPFYWANLVYRKPLIQTNNAALGTWWG